MASAARWELRKGKLFRVFLPVRGGKKEVRCESRLRLSADCKYLVFRVGGDELRLELVGTTPPVDYVEGYEIVTRKKFVVEFVGQRAEFELEVGRRPTPEADVQKAKFIEWTSHAAHKEMLLDVVSAAIIGSLLVKAVGRLPFSHHTKLWQREERRAEYVYSLFPSICVNDGDRNWRISLEGLLLNDELMEDIRLRLWAECE